MKKNKRKVTPLAKRLRKALAESNTRERQMVDQLNAIRAILNLEPVVFRTTVFCGTLWTADRLPITADAKSSFISCQFIDGVQGAP